MLPSALDPGTEKSKTTKLILGSSLYKSYLIKLIPSTSQYKSYHIYNSDVL